MGRGRKKGYLLEARSVGGKRLQEKKVEDCSSYPFLLGKPTSSLVHIYILYL